MPRQICPIFARCSLAFFDAGLLLAIFFYPGRLARCLPAFFDALLRFHDLDTPIFPKLYGGRWQCETCRGNFDKQMRGDEERPVQWRNLLRQSLEEGCWKARPVVICIRQRDRETDRQTETDTILSNILCRPVHSLLAITPKRARRLSCLSSGCSSHFIILHQNL